MKYSFDVQKDFWLAQKALIQKTYHQDNTIVSLIFE